MKHDGNSSRQCAGVISRPPRQSVKTWRLIDSGPCHPFYNMAADEALFRLAGESVAVRFYDWDPPALSLGYFQSAADFDLDALRAKGIPVVRRPTGGGAIYHCRELTFAIAAGAPAVQSLGTTIGARYERIHGALIKALAVFGIRAAMRGGGLEPPFSPSEHRLCFNRTIGCDIVAGGRKLVGSAQRRASEGFLQHGSIPLWRNPMTPGSAWANESSEYEVTYRSLGSALKVALEELFGVKLLAGGLSEEEEAVAAALVKEKYSTGKWNFRR